MLKLAGVSTLNSLSCPLTDPTTKMNRTTSATTLDKEVALDGALSCPMAML